MKHAARCAILVGLCTGVLTYNRAQLAAADNAANATITLEQIIRYAQTRVVKLYGAAVGREVGYGTGVLVSPEGRILTANTPLLTARNLRAVLDDGRSFAASVTARDPVTQTALLKIDARDLPHFELPTHPEMLPGDTLIAVANPFRVASGSEPVSITIGVYAGQTRLDARYRTRDFPYDGPVLLTDIVTSSPGSAGGAIVNLDGQLVGLIGRRAVSRRTNTWLNYAFPLETLQSLLRDAPRQSPERLDNANPPTPTRLGILLFDLGGRARAAYIERVRPGSPAQRAGLQPNDLVIAVHNQAISTCEELRQALREWPRNADLPLLVKRGDDVVELNIPASEVRP